MPTKKPAPAKAPVKRSPAVTTSVVGARQKAPATQAAPKSQPAQPTEKFQRPAPTHVYRPQVVTHVKTLSNGQPRPKSRRSK